MAWTVRLSGHKGHLSPFQLERLVSPTGDSKIIASERIEILNFSQFPGGFLFPGLLSTNYCRVARRYGMLYITSEGFHKSINAMGGWRLAGPGEA
jgi:hypothetical protein